MQINICDICKAKVSHLVNIPQLYRIDDKIKEMCSQCDKELDETINRGLAKFNDWKVEAFKQLCLKKTK